MTASDDEQHEVDRRERPAPERPHRVGQPDQRPEHEHQDPGPHDRARRAAARASSRRPAPRARRRPRRPPSRDMPLAAQRDEADGQRDRADEEVEDVLAAVEPQARADGARPRRAPRAPCRRRRRRAPAGRSRGRSRPRASSTSMTAPQTTWMKRVPRDRRSRTGMGSRFAGVPARSRAPTTASPWASSAGAEHREVRRAAIGGHAGSGAALTATAAPGRARPARPAASPAAQTQVDGPPSNFAWWTSETTAVDATRTSELSANGRTAWGRRSSRGERRAQREREEDRRVRARQHRRERPRPEPHGRCRAPRQG